MLTHSPARIASLASQKGEGADDRAEAHRAPLLGAGFILRWESPAKNLLATLDFN